MSERITAIVDPMTGEFCSDGMKPGRQIIDVPRNPDPHRERYSGNPANPFVEKTPNEQNDHARKQREAAATAQWDAGDRDIVLSVLAATLGHPPTPQDEASAKSAYVKYKQG